MRTVLALGAALAFGAAACNAILGIEDQRLRADAGPPADGGSDAVDDPDGDSAADTGVDAMSAYQRAVLDDQPFVYVRFGEDSGATTATDEMGHLSGTYPASGAKLGVEGAIASDLDTALELGGISSLTFPPGADFPDAAHFSVELWIRRAVDGLPGFVLDNESYPRRGWSLYAQGAGVFFERRGDAASVSANADNGLPDTAWHHVVGTWEGSVQRLYVDTNLVASIASTVSISRVPGVFTIGGQNCECSSNFFTGGLDDLAIYDRALTPDRIAAHWRAAGR